MNCLKPMHYQIVYCNKLTGDTVGCFQHLLFRGVDILDCTQSFTVQDGSAQENQEDEANIKKRRCDH